VCPFIVETHPSPGHWHRFGYLLRLVLLLNQRTELPNVLICMFLKLWMQRTSYRAANNRSQTVHEAYLEARRKKNCQNEGAQPSTFGRSVFTTRNKTVDASLRDTFHL